MDITFFEDELFRRWNERNRQNGERHIVKDGVISPPDYNASALKVVFALKEFNDPLGDGEAIDYTYEESDIRQFVGEDGGRPATWDNLARWAIALRSLIEGKPVPFDELPPSSSEMRRSNLKSVAAVNVKKIAGRSKSDYKTIVDAAKYDAGLLLEQLRAYQPDIIVCCGEGVYDGLKGFVFANERITNLPIMPGNFHSFIVNDRTTVVDFWHPQYPAIEDQDMYQKFVEVARIALAK
ncbi:hypothetical protein [Hyphobacterium sp.]|uniref:hypothetical protein n=1 Tax=Hyphobacterium sp. TaxID=2004662 RepID=UPI003BA85E66